MNKKSNINQYLDVVARSKLFEGTTKDEAAAMLSCLDAKVKHFDKGEFVLHEGDNVSAIGLVLEGSALVEQVDVWGNRNIVTKIGPAQTFATAFACAQNIKANVNVVANAKTAILFLDVQKVLTVCSSACSHHNKIVRNLISELAEKNLNLSDKMTHVCKRTTREKVMSYLSSESARAGSKEFDIPFSRQQFADYLSVNRSGLSAELTKLKLEGLIEYNRCHFTIKLEY